MNRHINGYTRPEVNYNKLDARVKTNSSNVNRVGEALQSYASPNEYIITRFVNAPSIDILLDEIRKFDFSLAEFNQLKNKTLTYIGVITDKGSDTPTQVLFTKTSFNIVDNREEILFHNYSYDGSIINITLRNNITQILVSAQQYEYVDHGRVNDIEDDIKTLDGDIKAVDGKTTLLEGTINSTREVVNGLENRVANNEYEIELIKEQGVSNPNQSSEVESLKTRVSTVEKNVQTLDNEIQIVQNAYIKSVSYNVQNGIFTFTKQDGTIFEVDLAIEKVVANFTYNQSANALELTLADGTKQKISMSAFIGGGSGVNASNIGNLIGSTWFIKEPFEKDEETWVLNLDFTSNNQEFVQMVYVPEVGLRYITADNQAVDVYAEVNNVVVREYREFTITGGAEVTNRITISIIKNIADYISGGTAKVGVTKEEVQEMINNALGQVLEGDC